jgi:hypothetical protein
MRQRRKLYQPSSSYHLAAIVSGLEQSARTPARLRVILSQPTLYQRIGNLAGIAGASWAIDQLSTQPFIAKGWPAPCKAARMRLRLRKADAR